MTIERRLVETPHGYVHVRVAAGAGTPLVLLHPGLSCSRVYLPLVGRLGARPLVMPDRLGFGESDRLESPITFAEYAAATLAALDGIGVERFDAFGVHTGSCEAIELAATHPARVRRLAVVEVPAFSEAEVAEFQSHYVAHPPPADDGSHLDWYWRWWAEGGFDGGAPRPTRYPPELVTEWVLEHLRALPHFWWAYHATIAHPTAERATRLTQPLLVFSTHDDLTEQTLRALATLPPQTEVVDLPHYRDVLRFFAWRPGDADEVIERLVAFLDA